MYISALTEGSFICRVLVYNPRERVPSRRIQELVTQLNYPDGLELSQDENYLLIAEGARSKIYRAWIGPTSAKFGTIEIFADNLPGFVANIRRSPRNTYWVGMARARHSKLPSVLDIYGDQPNVRGALVALAEKQVIFDEPKYGIVVELDVKGNIIRTLQDPEGSLYTGVSEVAEEKGIVYIASPKKRFVGILNLRTLPGGVSGTTGGALPGDQGAGGTGGTSGGTTGGTSGGTGGTNGGTNGGTGGTNGGTGGNGIINITPGQIDDAAMQRILDNVRNNLRTMSLEQVEQAVLLLVRRLIEVQIEARRAIERASKLEADLQRLQELIGQGAWQAVTKRGKLPVKLGLFAQRSSTSEASGFV
nr:hypothetical protein BaRGS_018330 [Batillaria attramentaria]